MIASLFAATSPTMIALLLFIAVVFAAAAFLLSLQDARLARAKARGQDEPFRLRRVNRPADQTRGGPIARFDRWFKYMAGDTGLKLDTTSAALLIAFSGCLVAGLLFIWGEQPVVALCGLVIGGIVPLFYLMRKHRKRVKQRQDQLPAALEMLARSVRAGQSLDQALASVGDHSPEPLATEFRYCAKQLEMGLSMPVVMRSLVERVRLYDVRIFTTTLTVHRQTGGNVARLLERLARVIRDRLTYRRQLRVSTGAGKASAIMVAIVAPLVFLFFFVYRPDYVHSMLNSTLGQTFLVVAIVLELIGLIWTVRLLKPSY